MLDYFNVGQLIEKLEGDEQFYGEISSVFCFNFLMQVWWVIFVIVTCKG